MSWLLTFSAVLPVAATEKPKWEMQFSSHSSHHQQGVPSDFTLSLLNPPADAFNLTAQPSKSMQVVTGPPTRTQKNGTPALSYPISITPATSGVVMLPEFSLTNADDSIIFKDESIVVSASDTTDELTLQVKPETTSIYAGQSLNIKYTLNSERSPLAFQAMQLTIPELLHPKFESFIPSGQPVSRARDTMNIAVNGQRLFSRRAVENRERVTLSFERKLTSKYPGVYEFNPAIAVVETNPDKAPYGPFQFRPNRLPARLSHYFTGSASGPGQHLITKSEPFKLEVKPLPKGAPDHFFGMVGKPEIEVSIDAEELVIGEPVQVSFHIYHPDVQGSKWLDLRDFPEFHHRFDIPGKPAPLEVIEDAGVIRQTVFPKSAGSAEIPSITFSYFDPDTRSYQDYVSSSIQIEIKKTPTSAPQATSDTADNNLNNTPKVVTIHDHVWSNSLTQKAQPEEQSNRYWAFLLLPPLWGGWKVFKRLEAECRLIHSQTALSQFKYWLNRNNDPLQALTIYLQKKNGVQPSGFTVQSLLDALEFSDIDPALIAKLDNWLKNYQNRFIERGTPLPASSISELVELINKIDRSWLWQNQWKAYLKKPG